MLSRRREVCAGFGVEDCWREIGVVGRSALRPRVKRMGYITVSRSDGLLDGQKAENFPAPHTWSRSAWVSKDHGNCTPDVRVAIFRGRSTRCDA